VGRWCNRAREVGRILYRTRKKREGTTENEDKGSRKDIKEGRGEKKKKKSKEGEEWKRNKIEGVVTGTV